MAASVLAGVNPIHGLYASFAGPVAGGVSRPQGSSSYPASTAGWKNTRHRRLTIRSVTLIDVYGSLHYAGRQFM